MVMHKDITENIPKNTQVQLEEIIGSLVKNRKLYACEVNKRFYEVGTINGIKDFEKYIKNVQ